MKTSSPCRLASTRKPEFRADMPLFSKEYFVEYCSVKRNDCCSGKACSAIKNGELQLRMVLRSQNSQLIKYLHLRCVSQDLANTIKKSCPLEIASNLSGHDSLRVQQLFDSEDGNSQSAAGQDLAAVLQMPSSASPDTQSPSDEIPRESSSPGPGKSQQRGGRPTRKNSQNSLAAAAAATPKSDAVEVDNSDCKPPSVCEIATAEINGDASPPKITLAVPSNSSDDIVTPPPASQTAKISESPKIQTINTVPMECVVETSHAPNADNALSAPVDTAIVVRAPKEQKISIRLFDSTSTASNSAVQRFVTKMPTKVTLRTDNLQSSVSTMSSSISSSTANSLTDTNVTPILEHCEPAAMYFPATSAAAVHLAEELKNQISESSELEKKISNWSISEIPKNSKTSEFNGLVSLKLKFNSEPTTTIKREIAPDASFTRSKRVAEEVLDDGDSGTMQHDSSDAATWVNSLSTDQMPIDDGVFQHKIASADGHEVGSPSVLDTCLKLASKAGTAKRARRNI